MTAPNLATDPVAKAAYDEPGSWGRLSDGWPSVAYTPAKFLLCSKAHIVPYGQYVVVGARDSDNSGYDYSHARIRIATKELAEKLEFVYLEMFEKCRHYIVEDLNWAKGGAA